MGLGAAPVRLLGGRFVLTMPAKTPARTLMQLRQVSRRLRLASPVLRVGWRGSPTLGHLFVVGQLSLMKPGQQEAEFPLSEDEACGGAEQEIWSEFGEQEIWSDFAAAEESWGEQSEAESWGESEFETRAGDDEAWGEEFEQDEGESWPGEAEVGWGSTETASATGP